MSAATSGKAAGRNGSAANPKGEAARRVIDMNKARAARAERAQDPPVLVLGDEEFVLPAEVPIDFVEFARLGAFVDAMRVLVGDDEMERLRSVRPPLSVPDLEGLVGDLERTYGMAEGD